MTEQELLGAETTAVPTDSNWSTRIPSDRARSLGKAPDELEPPLADRSITLAQANVQLRHEIQQRKRAEESLLKEQQYLRHLLDLQDRDRRMVGYEIHDGLVQQLAAAIMQFQIFGAVAEQKAKEARATFERGVGMLNECMREARRLINDLRSPILDEFGLVAAVEDLIAQDGAPKKPEIDFVHQLGRERLEPSLENVIFRIVQESLTNARRYSQSARVLVRLTQRNRYIRVEVQDWGIGFDPREVGHDHFGIQGIRQRARLFGGSATITTALGKGTRNVVHLPLGGDAGTAIPAAESDE
jgi:signal transduction histidine kinase